VIALVLPGVVFLVLVAWWAWIGRDPHPDSIVPRWRPPEDLAPGLAGTLVDQRFDPRDALATILDLARRGYLAIREVHPSGVPADHPGAGFLREILDRLELWETEWQFVRTGRSWDDLEGFEKTTLAVLFGAGVAEPGATTTMSELEGSFADGFAAIRREHDRALVERGYFTSSPARTRREWFLLAGVFGVVAGIALSRGDLAFTAGAAASGGLVALFAPWMPAATRAGARARDVTLGVREYLARAERAEIEHRYRDAALPDPFDTLLPWALSLGVADAWIEEFRGALAVTPAWYEQVGATGVSPSDGLAAFCEVSVIVVSAG